MPGVAVDGIVNRGNDLLNLINNILAKIEANVAGAVDTVTAAFDAATDVEVRFEIATDLAIAAHSIGRDVDLEAAGVLTVTADAVDPDGKPLPQGEIGRLAVRGPTGCRYLADDRQKNYVENGWNITGDSFSQTEDGYFHFAARNDDMIISSGYNIAGPEVEAALLSHAAVAECAVIGVADALKGQMPLGPLHSWEAEAPPEAFRPLSLPL